MTHLVVVILELQCIIADYHKSQRVLAARRGF